MKFKKGSAEAKKFMAKLRAKRKKNIPDRKYKKIHLEFEPIKKLSGEEESKAIYNYLQDRNQRLTHGYHTQPNITEEAKKSREKQYRSQIKKEYKKVKAYKEPKKRKLSGVHTDTKSHNLKVNFFSGAGAICGDLYKELEYLYTDENWLIRQVTNLQNKIKSAKSPLIKKGLKMALSIAKQSLKNKQRRIREQKALIKKSLK